MEGDVRGGAANWHAGPVPATTTPLTDTDLRHLTRCVDLAEEALDAGDEPFGSVLVDAAGTALHEDRKPDGRRRPDPASGVRARPVGGRAPVTGAAGRRHGLHLG